MAYKVSLQERAKADIQNIYQYIEAYSYILAKKWFVDIKDKISSLSTMPYRYSIIPEVNLLGDELHQLVCGKRTACYRIIYRVIEQDKEVRILTVRHAARKPLDIEDLSA